jgi:hypothetical protein
MAHVPAQAHPQHTNVHVSDASRIENGTGPPCENTRGARGGLRRARRQVNARLGHIEAVLAAIVLLLLLLGEASVVDAL